MTSRTGFALAPCVLALLAGAALAQDKKDDDPKAPPAAESSVKADPATLLAKMETLFRVAVKTPASTRLPEDAPKEVRDEQTRRVQAWHDAIRGLAQTSDDYLRALAGDPASPRGLYLRGVGKILASGLSDKKSAPGLRGEAIDALTKFLAAADAKDVMRPDAEMHLGQAIVLDAGDDASRVEEAVGHLRVAVDAFQKDGRHDDAGMCAWYAMASLRAVDREKEMAAFAEAVHASDADFGASTGTIRNYAESTKFALGAKLPAISDAKDADGKPVSFAPAGGPLLVHFFQTGEPGTGRGLQYREVETEVAPLWEKYHDKGLRVVGVCLDAAMTPEEAEQKKKYWTDVVGRKGEFHDGSLASARSWTERNGVAWPWTWSGRWFEDPIAKAFGGVGKDLPIPYAVLVDKEGVVRWKGRAPFLGMPEELAKLIP